MRNKAKCPLLLSFVLEVITNDIRPEKLIKGIKVGKEEGELWLFADDLTISTENLKSN